MKPFYIAFHEGHFEIAAETIRKNLELLSPLLRRHRQNPRAFSLERLVLPVIKQGGLALALANDDDGLAQMRRIVESEPELQPWSHHLDRHDLSRRFIPRIEDRIHASTPCLQTELKCSIGTTDGRLVAHLVLYLEKAGRLARVRSGRTWRLLPPDSPEIPPADPQPEPPAKPIPRARPRVPSHRTDRTAPLRPVELSSLPRIALPKALAKWELVEKGRLPDDCPVPPTSFEGRDADWRSPSVERMSPALRPDPSIRRFFPSKSGVVMTTDKRRWPHFGGNEASALHYDSNGQISVKNTLQHGLLRAYLPPFGTALIGVSLDGVVHAHNEILTPIFATPLSDAPENATIFDPPIAISPEADRYLFALGDRVHCVGRNGDALWSRQFPDARWFHAADYYGTGSNQPDLGPPPRAESRPPSVSPTIRMAEPRRTIYGWHPTDDWPPDGSPDEFEAKRARWLMARHFGIPEAAVDEYAAFSAALPADLSVDESGTPHASEDAWRPRFVRELSRRQEASPYGTCEIREVEATDSPPMTYIHEVAFSSTCGTAFVATSEGAVWALDDAGDAVRAYVGLGGPLGPPCITGRRTRRIVHLDDHLYLMTEAQLFVLARDELQVVLDVLPREEIYNTPNGFGLLSERRVRWYGRDGTYLGTILAKHPIRRLYRAGTETVIETRTERAVFCDVPVW